LRRSRIGARIGHCLIGTAERFCFFAITLTVESATTVAVVFNRAAGHAAKQTAMATMNATIGSKRVNFTFRSLQKPYVRAALRSAAYAGAKLRVVVCAWQEVRAEADYLCSGLGCSSSSLFPGVVTGVTTTRTS
jgi:hypothetical protein